MPSLCNNRCLSSHCGKPSLLALRISDPQPSCMCRFSLWRGISRSRRPSLPSEKIPLRCVSLRLPSQTLASLPYRRKPLYCRGFCSCHGWRLLYSIRFCLRRRFYPYRSFPLRSLGSCIRNPSYKSGRAGISVHRKTFSRKL